MSASYLLVIVIVIILILIGSLVLSKGYQSWLYRLFSGLFAAFLLFICFLAVKISYGPGSDTLEVKTTNYSKKKGYIYIFEGQGCAASVKYGYPVNANEESWLEVGGKLGDLKTLVLLTEADSIYQLPAPDYDNATLDIWEKELEVADECFREQIKLFRREQIYFSIAIGLLLFGLLFLFAYRRKYKPNKRKGIAS